MDLVVRDVVHEDVLLAVPVEVLHLPLVDHRLLERLTGPEGALDHRLGACVAQLGPDEGTALAGLDVLELDDREQSFREVEGHAVAEVIGGKGHQST